MCVCVIYYYQRHNLRGLPQLLEIVSTVLRTQDIRLMGLLTIPLHYRRVQWNSRETLKSFFPLVLHNGRAAFFVCFGFRLFRAKPLVYLCIYIAQYNLCLITFMLYFNSHNLRRFCCIIANCTVHCKMSCTYSIREWEARTELVNGSDSSSR